MIHRDIVRVELSKVYGSLLDEALNRLRRPPRRLYMRVNTMYTSRDMVIDTLRTEGVEAMVDEHVEDAVYVDIAGPFKIECNSEKRIIVDEKTAISLMLGVNLYRPGIIKSDFFEKDEYVLATTPSGIPAACLKTTCSRREALAADRGLIGVNVSSPYRAPRVRETSLYSRGLIYVQSAPSIITTHVLDPKPGELVVDMNASPGGKTSHVIQLTRGKTRVIAIDRNEKKIKELYQTLNRLGLDLNVIMLPWDSRYIHLDLNIREKADKVLIDPPCSNLGVRPVIDWDKSLRDISNLSNYQKQFLKAAWWVLRPGGILIYSTCTITLNENEENVLYAINDLGFKVVELDKPPPYSEVVKYKGITAYRFSPFTYDMPGYFIAVLTK